MQNNNNFYQVSNDNVKKAYAIFIKGGLLESRDPSIALKKTNEVERLLGLQLTSELDYGQYSKSLIDMLLGFNLDGIVGPGAKEVLREHVAHLVKYNSLMPVSSADLVMAAPIQSSTQNAQVEPQPTDDKDIKEVYDIYMSESRSPLKSGNPSVVLDKTNKVEALLHLPPTSELNCGQYSKSLIDTLLGFNLERIVGPKATENLKAQINFDIEYHHLTSAPEANLAGQSSTNETDQLL